MKAGCIHIFMDLFHKAGAKQKNKAISQKKKQESGQNPEKLAYSTYTENLIEIAMAYANLVKTHPELTNTDSITWKQMFVEWANAFEDVYQDPQCWEEGDYLIRIAVYAKVKILAFAGLDTEMTWDEMKVKYPEYRDCMTEEREREFVKDCFTLYEKEGFAKNFWSQGGDYKKYHGQPFAVISRAEEDDVDLECLPMWKIRFDDGFEMDAYPDEIIPSEMANNGCPKKYLTEEVV